MVHCLLDAAGDDWVVVAAEVAGIFEVVGVADVAGVVKIVEPLQAKPCLAPLRWSAAVASGAVHLQVEPCLAPLLGRDADDLVVVAMAAIFEPEGSWHAFGP